MTPTGLEPRNVNTLTDNDLQYTPDSRAAKSDASGARNGDFDADLLAVIDAWPDLAETVKADILAVVQATESAGTTI